MGMDLLINSINEGSATRPIDQMIVTFNNTRSLPQQLLHKIVKNRFFSRKEPSQL